MQNAKLFVGRWLAAAILIETYKLVVCPLSRYATAPPEWEPNEPLTSLLDIPYSLNISYDPNRIFTPSLDFLILRGEKASFFYVYCTRQDAKRQDFLEGEFTYF